MSASSASPPETRRHDAVVDLRSGVFFELENEIFTDNRFFRFIISPTEVLLHIPEQPILDIFVKYHTAMSVAYISNPAPFM